MFRKGIYKIEDVLSNINHLRKKIDKVEFDGDMVHMSSLRYHTFKESGIKCVECGIEGKYFAKEGNNEEGPFHFNLYAIDEEGDEVLMTKDHIIPISKGGLDRIGNLQTMCINCNEEKGDKV